MKRMVVRRNRNDNENDNLSEQEIKEIKEMNDSEIEYYSKGEFFEKSYEIFMSVLSYLFGTIKFFLKISGIYLLWICLHYFSAHLYVQLCVPRTIIGFIMSPFMMATPHCQGLRWIVYNAAGVMSNMWIMIGSWSYSMLWIIKSENSDN